MESAWINSCLLAYSMDQSPSWKANRFSASQETPRTLWKPKVHYRIYNCQPPALSWARLIQSMSPYPFLKIKLNVILPSTSGSSKWSLSLSFPHQNSVHTGPLSHTCYMHLLTYYSLFYQFYMPYQFHADTKINKNIIPDLSPKSIISFLAVYK
jgi:hypothetical protein